MGLIRDLEQMLAKQHLPAWWRKLTYAKQTSWYDEWAEYDEDAMSEFKDWVDDNPVKPAKGPARANLVTSLAAGSGDWLDEFGKEWDASAKAAAEPDDAGDSWFLGWRKNEHERRTLAYDDGDLSAPVECIEPVGGWHYPLIDLDHDAALIESSTRGHHHLYINRRLTWAQYLHLLSAMADVGLVQRGFVEATKIRGYSALRLPWVEKGNE